MAYPALELVDVAYALRHLHAPVIRLNPPDISTLMDICWSDVGVANLLSGFFTDALGRWRMSGRYPDLLKRRAESMMRLAERLLGEGEYDLAVLNAEYAAQLYIKSVLLRLTGEEWRGHGIRTLLGAVALAAQGGRLRDVVENIVDFTKR